MEELKWRICEAGRNFKEDAIVIPLNNPDDTDARLVRCAIYDSRYILVSDLKKLETEEL